MTDFYHYPVMTKELLDILSPKENDKLMIDANLGEGGHSYAFLDKYDKLKITGIDADKDIIEIAKKRLEKFAGRIYFFSGWSYDFFTDYSTEYKRPDIILFDLGVSLYHYKASKRGYSFDIDEYLDMRIDASCGITAAELMAKLPEKELADLLYNNANERYSRRIASRIVNERQKGAITTTFALAEIVKKAVPSSYRYGRTHPATKTFQAIRIAVNGELSKLSLILEAAFKVLEPGGKLAVLSYHSSEDKIVKQFFKMMNRDCICPQDAVVCRCGGNRSINILTKKGIVPSEEEIERNPPSRSARLRVIEKILDGAGSET